MITSCAAMSSKNIAIKINLLTVDKDMNSIDAVCNLYSESSKKDVLAPKEFEFLTQCSSINIICKSGNLTGEYGVPRPIDNSQGESFIINAGIGYIFDRAIDAVTPMGSLMNFMNDPEEECSTEREITVVLE